MRFNTIIAALIIGASAQTTTAQSTLDHPVEQATPFHLDTGVLSNEGPTAAIVYRDVVRVRGAAWVRLYLGHTVLSRGSTLRVTSLKDMEVQELGQTELLMWDNSTAYFNGDAVMVEVVAGPGGDASRVRVEEVGFAVNNHPEGDPGECGICGADNRAPSSEDWSCRLFPSGCTASVYTEESCLVTAGHCIGGSMVIQFNVPNSQANCNTVNPPVADQFPITASDFQNAGVGDDWGVMTSGTNNLNQRPYDRYGALRPLASSQASNGQTLGMWGYGVDNTCTRSQTQQVAAGPQTWLGSDWIEFDIDLRGGNSGSAIIRNNTIVGIATHCSVGCPNFGTRIDDAAFVVGRQLCEQSAPPVNDDCMDAIDLGSSAPVSDTFDNTFATNDTNGAPLLDPACDIFGDSPGILSDLWWTWTAPADGDASFHTCSSGLDTKMALYTMTCPTSTGDEIACSDDGTCATSGESQIDVVVTSGTTYIMRVGAWGTDADPSGPTGSGEVFVEFTPAPPVTGACCYDDGSCTDETGPDCTSLGGAYEGDGTDCATTNCPQPPSTGACCYDDGSCAVATSADCTSTGGDYEGDDTDCATTNCPQPPSTGACCYDDGSCAVATSADCTSTGGDYEGDDTDCATTNCPQPPVIGACCFNDGSCSDETEADCESFAGTYFGDATECSFVKCEVVDLCPSDCVEDGIVDVQDMLAVLAEWGTNGPCDIAPPGGDGIIDILDLLQVLQDWGPCLIKE